MFCSSKAPISPRLSPLRRIIGTIDSTEVALEPEMLVIADAQRATALGGVMGGGDSEISGTSKRIALESAYFHPTSVRRTSKRLGLKTEASMRFERGGDVAAPPAGIARAAALFTRLGGGTAVGPLIDRYPSPRARARAHLAGEADARDAREDDASATVMSGLAGRLGRLPYHA